MSSELTRKPPANILLELLLKLNPDWLKQEAFTMGNSDAQNWEHLYTQFKGSNGDPVICMVHNKTKKFIYVDVKSRRILSKQEALNYRVDVTGLHIIYSGAAPQDCPPPDSLVKIA